MMPRSPRSRLRLLQMMYRFGRNKICSLAACMCFAVALTDMFKGPGTRAGMGFLLGFEAVLVQQRWVDRVGRLTSGIMADKSDQQLHTD